MKLTAALLLGAFMGAALTYWVLRPERLSEPRYLDEGDDGVQPADPWLADWRAMWPEDPAVTSRDVYRILRTDVQRRPD